MAKRGKPIRCDSWKLMADATTVAMARDTVVAYRRLVHALTGILLVHWKDMHAADVQDIERLFHQTKKNPHARYGDWFARNFPKFPAYLRRAATMAAQGTASSFLTRYAAWQRGDRRFREQRPPRLGRSGHWPVLYAANGGAGAMIRHEGDVVEIKLYDKDSGDWLWRRAAVVSRGKRHGTAGAVPMSPMLVVEGASLALAQPYEFHRPRQGTKTPDRVCAVDLGVNKQAVCAIVSPEGTVLARRSFHLGAHIDRRDKLTAQIRSKARQTMGAGGTLSPGFCRTLYRRIEGINIHMARTLSRHILCFAGEFGARTIVFERLKGFRPKGGRKRSPMKQRFHGWLHRALVRQAEASAEEKGLRVAFVPPRGTSSWAYDGSGRVTRGLTNYSRCRFASGKEYDCDLNAAYNIAARFFVRRERLLRLKQERLAAQAEPKRTSPAAPKARWPVRGGRSAAGPRMPVTLSTLWPFQLQAAA